MTPAETLFLQRPPTNADITAGEQVCLVCSREARDEYVELGNLPEDLQALIHANAPGSKDFQAVCVRCARLFERAKEHILSEAAMNKDGSFVLSTPLRLDSDERFTGKGVTIAFLDSGFYPHKDLTEPENRILA